MMIISTRTPRKILAHITMSTVLQLDQAKYVMVPQLLFFARNKLISIITFISNELRLTFCRLSFMWVLRD